ncbi:uncharacterized protein YndB with AHSA1/START domain [Solirubrobacter pauli]|uniref:Uncharacterized protein YndB with AHSA1/START domain n=2 Tax=Solirubrobacter pauli TaxID=166793 RepID=A0A660L2K9_9ACTN|nr:uncharacterized protein YndB with AHSA1/START domain [Solirubrobacter pauli]
MRVVMRDSVRAWQAPPAAVWAVLVDPLSYPLWLAGVKDVLWADEDWPQPDAGLDYRFRWGPFTLRGRATVLEAQPSGHLRLRWKRRLLGDAIAEFTIAETTDGCAVDFRETPRGLFVGLSANPFATGVAAGYNTASLARLRRLVERQEPTT